MKSVISGGVYVGNDTSHERQSDFFARNRGLSFVQPFSKKWLCHFFDSLGVIFYVSCSNSMPRSRNSRQ